MTTDRDGPRSNPYRPTEMACEACCFARGEHADFCEFWLVPPAAITHDGENAATALPNTRTWWLVPEVEMSREELYGTYPL